MQTKRMLELLKIERKCVQRNIDGQCNRDCAKCDLVQPDSEVIEMYTEAIDRLSPKPVAALSCINNLKYGNCPRCGKMRCNYDYPHFCGHCGQARKWDKPKTN